jgi:hypothetical protein
MDLMGNFKQIGRANEVKIRAQDDQVREVENAPPPDAQLVGLIALRGGVPRVQLHVGEDRELGDIILLPKFSSSSAQQGSAGSQARQQQGQRHPTLIPHRALQAGDQAPELKTRMTAARYKSASTTRGK